MVILLDCENSNFFICFCILHYCVMLILIFHLLVDTALFVQCCLAQSRRKLRRARVSFCAKGWGPGKKPACLTKTVVVVMGHKIEFFIFFFI